MRKQALLPLLLTLGVVSADAQEPDFLTRIRTFNDFVSVAVSVEGPYEDRTTKFIVPAADDPSLLALHFQNARRYRFHYEFLSAVYPDRFPGLTLEEYVGLTGRRATRRYFAGTITRYNGPARNAYGFTIYTVGGDSRELLDVAEVRSVYESLRAVFQPEPLEYAPRRAAEILEARSWDAPGFPIRDVGDQALPRAIGYTPATSYGTLRLYTLEELHAAAAAGELDWQTIAVVDEAPDDIEAVIGGLATGSPQGELSHLATRLARRGVPNVFVRDARAVFTPHEGELVRLDVSTDDFAVRAATLQEAETWWAENRPTLPPVPEPDTQHLDLELITEIDVSGGQTAALRRFGGKASGLAALYRHLPASYRTDGFAIPFHYYAEFMASNTIPTLEDPTVDVSYEEYVRELLLHERFRRDGSFRRARLAEFRDYMREHGVVPATLVAGIGDRILEIFGDPMVKVRFRSSSNSEDSVEFTGAGLYDSTSVCMADELDGDDTGPSRCDPTKSKERTIRRALKKVWASLWNHRAFEEREYFQIDHRRTAMAVLVTRAYPSEDSNGVLFTGNPASREDRRYVVNAQLGDESVVTPGVGIESEKDLLVLASGRLRKVRRVRESSLTVPGQNVLTDEQLQELGEVVADVADDFLDHYDLGEHPREDVLVDFEFKFQDGRLVIKQARPFLLNDPSPPGPTFFIDVARDVEMCTQFEDDRLPYDEYRLKSRIELLPGSIDLPARAVHVPREMIGRLELGPQRQELQPLNAGLFEVRRVGDGDTYSWTYTQDFDVDGRVFQVRFDKAFYVSDGAPEELRWTLDEEALERGFSMHGRETQFDDFRQGVRYGSCRHASLTLWEATAEFEGGDRARFLKRFEPPFVGSAPAFVTSGEARLAGVDYSESSFWRLVYAAEHHNWQEKFVLVFNPPITVGETEGVAALYLKEEFRQSPADAALLDAEFNVLRELAVVSYSEHPVSAPEFVRGNTNGDARVDLSDAVLILDHLFLGGSAPACSKSADTDDNGGIDLSDAVYLLVHLFLGGAAPPAPFPECGGDPTIDELDCAQTDECAKTDLETAGEQAR